MLTLRPSAERLRTRLEWLDSRHTFSFAEHYDPRFMGFRALKVLNEDRVSPGRGFATHPHRDMEIVSYVIEGALRHQDSMGTGSIIRAGDVQRMTAGTGVLHSEANASGTEPVHFLQIWLTPRKQRLTPGYEQRSFPPDARRGRLTLVGSIDGRDSSLTIHQDVDMYSAVLESDDHVEHPLAPGRHAWVHVVRGRVELNGSALSAGDGAALSEVAAAEFRARMSSEVLLFDLA